MSDYFYVRLSDSIVFLLLVSADKDVVPWSKNDYQQDVVLIR